MFCTKYPVFPAIVIALTGILMTGHPAHAGGGADDDHQGVPAPTRPVTQTMTAEDYETRLRVLQAAFRHMESEVARLQGELDTAQERAVAAGAAAHKKALADAEQKRKDQARFDAANARVSKEVGRGLTTAAQAVGITPGSDLRKMASGEKPVLGRDAQHAVREVQKGAQKAEREINRIGQQLKRKFKF